MVSCKPTRRQADDRHLPQATLGATAPAAEAWCSSARGTSLPEPCGVLCGEKAVPVPWAAAGVVGEAGKVQRSTFSVEGESSNV